MIDTLTGNDAAGVALLRSIRHSNTFVKPVAEIAVLSSVAGVPWVVERSYIVPPVPDTVCAFRR